MTKERQELGRWGEEQALKKLKSLGYELVARNYRSALGEIDLIARDGDTLVFLEIKTRRESSLAYAKEAVNLKKQSKIIKTAIAYLRERNCPDAKARFDVVAVRLHSGQPEIEVIQNAFEAGWSG